MAEWKVLVTDGLDGSGLDILRKTALVEDSTGISQDELLTIIGGYNALIVRGRTKVNQAVFDAARGLKVVGRAGVGVDNIDLESAVAHGVTVVNAPRSTSVAVAELALGLMLALARQIPHADSTMKAGRWIKKDLEGVELNGKVVGVIGLGNIGSLVCQYTKAIGMSVLGYDPLYSAEQTRERGAEPASLPELFTRSDWISLHVPLTPDTRGMINRQALSQMKPGVRLICTARGGLIDEDALLEALESGPVAGAALDVFHKEPPGLNGLVGHPKVIATPHIGAQTGEAQSRASKDIAEEVLAALYGKPLRWKVA